MSLDEDRCHGPDDRRLEPGHLARQHPRAGSPADTPEEHLRRLMAEIDRRLPRKYGAGQHEHGGTLSRKPVLGELVDEACDALVYSLTLEEQVRTVDALLAWGIEREDWNLVRAALNLVRTGNSEGLRS